MDHEYLFIKNQWLEKHQLITNVKEIGKYDMLYETELDIEGQVNQSNQMKKEDIGKYVEYFRERRPLI
jgi:hypothetical protein